MKCFSLPGVYLEKSKFMDKRTVPTQQQILEYREKIEQFKRLKSELEDFESKYKTSCYLFKDGNKCGLKDLAGNILIPAIFDDIRYTFKDKVRNWPVPVVLEGKFGLAATDGSGGLILDCVYDYIVFRGGYYLLHKGDMKGVYARGKLIYPIDCDMIYNNPRATVLMFGKGRKYGFISLAEGVISKQLYDDFSSLKGELVQVKWNGHSGYIDQDGNFTLNEQDGHFRW